MSKSEIVHARIDPELKSSVEAILCRLGLSSSDAINLFYKQIELNGGLPFAVRLPEKLIAEQKLMAELKQGEQSAESGGWLSLDESKKGQKK